MKPTKFILTILCCTLIVSGCDFVRRSLGKPTSEDINRIRLEKVALEAARADSLARVEAAEKAVLDSLKAMEDANRIRRYYILVGSFKVVENADRLAEKLQSDGFDVHCFNISEGMTSVAICGNDDIEAITEKIKELKSDPDFKMEAYIYDYENKVIIK